ncbi:FG-GAP-like repeat-containing protein [Silvibacterium acidisoli]|uniref:FG-GAP-like repeat-containing protein n=1 Tax=Acidobacteriaceae bacterium ZG23-2 TaxID=2883246 RepID=UPI00406C107F
MTVGALLGVGCHSASKLPEPKSQAYADFTRTFYVGLAALQVGDDVRADANLGQAAQMVPGEPAGWANWGILALRQRSFDAAAQRLGRAKELAPKNDRLDYLLGLLESDRGNSSQAIAHLRDAAQENPQNLRAIYQLASEVERQGDANSDADFQKLMQQILSVQPKNLAALLELSRISAKRGDVATLRATVEKIAAQSAAWPADIKQQLMSLQAATLGPEPRPAATRSVFLRNVLMQLPEFRSNLSQIKPQPGEEAIPFTRFLRLATPVFEPAPSDSALAFTPQRLANIPAGKWDWVGAVYLNGTGDPVVAAANAHEVHLSTGAGLSFPGSTTAPSPEGVVPVDFNYDFKTGLVLAGAGGVRFMRQDDVSKFIDVSAQTRLTSSILNASYSGAWAADIEADGDLDIVMGSEAGEPAVLRNNGDGTFQPIHPFSGVSGIRQFVWADLNGDGNPEASLIDGAGHLHVFMNERSGRFHEQPLPSGFDNVKALAVGDVNHDGNFALLVVRANGEVVALSLPADGMDWHESTIATVPNAAAYLAHQVRLFAGDIDNNGALDLLLAPVESPQNPLIWLQDEQSHFTLISQPVASARIFGLADLKDDGRIDLLGVSSDGQAVDEVNHQTKNYHWQTIRARARQTTGDQRVNSFGIGGDIEVRSGLLVQKQPITSPSLHFGLGRQTGVDVARIVWPNGSVRAEFALKADQQIVTEQRLKGSCPFLFAFNGKRMEFVKDTVPWGSAIGLRINALGSARIGATEEWYKIRGDQLLPHDGYYDLRITGELWETYYYDYLQLMTVDHPAGTEVFTDERYSVPAVKPSVTATAEPQPIARAVDDNGEDVTDVVKSLDGRYLDNFGRGQYQGITRDHYVEIELGDDVPTSGPVWLIAQGWLHPSDSSLNIAMSQGNHPAPRPLSLEVSDGRGGWKTVKENLGFPAGRNKTCLIDISGVFVPGAPRRLRLRTNLEVYWDRIQWAKGLPDTSVQVGKLEPASADLHYRGYSVIHQANASSPEIPDYNQLLASTQIWRDLEGYYTRYGDVRPLLAGVDDRYVIMNAGDEMSLRFAAPAPPPSGWVRDYVIAGDGWIKDGDYNSTNSKTVLPYPYHARNEYDTPPSTLAEDWEYKHHAADWNTWQTRYVTPEGFNNALRGSSGK